MDLLLHLVEHALEDTVPLVPFLLVTYLALEALEHAAGDRVNGAVKRAGAAGPLVGALLGIVPQCGFSAMAATLYAGRVITLGTLLAVFLSTSDEMLPLLVAERTDAGALAEILLMKAGIAAVTGLVIDLGLRALRRNARVHAALRRAARGSHDEDLIEEMAEAGEGAEHIHRLCEHEHGGSGHSAVWSIVRSALSHTIQVSVFIFLVTFILVAVLETVGEDALSAFLSGNQTLAVFASALVGLVPNCAASVVITQLYLEGVLGFGPLMAGTLISAGVGYLVLFRTNHNARENAIILVLLYLIGVVWGLLLSGFTL